MCDFSSGDFKLKQKKIEECFAWACDENKQNSVVASSSVGSRKVVASGAGEGGRGTRVRRSGEVVAGRAGGWRLALTVGSGLGRGERGVERRGGREWRARSAAAAAAAPARLRPRAREPTRVTPRGSGTSHVERN